MKVSSTVLKTNGVGDNLVEFTKLVHLSDRYQIDNPKFSTNKKVRRTLKIRQRRVNRKIEGSKNRKKAANNVGRFHKKITDRRTAYQWNVANTIVSRKVDAIALEDLNISGMLTRCQVKTDEKTGRFLTHIPHPKLSQIKKASQVVHNN